MIEGTPDLCMQRDQSIIQSINYLKNTCLSDVCNTFIVMDYMHYGPAIILICIPCYANNKIILPMYWFSPSKIDGTTEHNGTTSLYQKILKLNKNILNI